VDFLRRPGMPSAPDAGETPRPGGPLRPGISDQAESGSWVDEDAVTPMLLFDCLRSGRWSWMLVQSVAHHDFATAGICVLGIASRWTLQTSLLATLVCCALLILAKRVIDRRVRRQAAPANAARGIRLTLKTSCWNLIFAVRGSSGGKYHRWHCLLRIRSLNREQSAARQKQTLRAEVVSPGTG